MASSSKSERDDLKYLWFVDEAFSGGVELVAKIYDLTKGKAGPLRSLFDCAETIFWHVGGPVLYRLEVMRVGILLYADEKVEVVARAVGSYVPHKVKTTSYKACGLVSQILELLVAVAFDVHRSGIVGTSQQYYAGYLEPMAMSWTYSMWKQFLKVPYAVTAVRVAAPPSLLVARKLNKLVLSLKAKHLPLAGYVPLLPVHRIEAVVYRDT